MDENKYYEYKEKIAGMKKKLIIGAVVGVLMGIYVFSLDDSIVSGILFGIFTAVMGGILIAGMIYTWTILPFTALNIAGLFLKGCISLALGGVIGPVVFIYYVVRVKSYEKENGIVNQKE